MRKAFLSAPSGVVGIIVLAVILIVAIIAPPLLTEQATTLHVANAYAQPSAQHWLGTDSLGRDLLARLLVATRLSIGLAFAAAALGAVLGMIFGIGAVLLRGGARSAALRGIDALIAFPSILVAIYFAAIIGPGILAVVLGVGIATSFPYARVTSSLSLAIIERDFISAARISGLSQFRIMRRYILPNISDTLAITTTVAISSSIIAVATLDFLGLGVQPPQFDWGTMLTDGVQAIYLTPWAALGPAFVIAISSLAFGFTGEAIARMMNPVLWAQRESSDSVGTQIDSTIVRVYTDSPMRSPSSDEAVLQVENLSVLFPRGRDAFKVVDNVSFWLRKGERLGIVGESGCGKTTLALAIAQLVPYPGTVDGSVQLQGRELLNGKGHSRDLNAFLGTRLAVVYQDPLSSLNPAVKIGRQMTEATKIYRNTSQRAALNMAVERLREVNISTAEVQLDRYPHELSGGMRQRVMIAMGMMMEPALFICDEPTTALDVTVQAQIMDLLARLNSDHESAIVLITHNLALVSQNTDRVLVMYAGRIVEDLTTKQLLDGGAHPYTRELLGAVPDMSRPPEERLEQIPGQAVDPANLPSGCAYNPRCQLAMAKCRIERPPLRLQDDSRRVACWAIDDGVKEAGKVGSP